MSIESPNTERSANDQELVRKLQEAVDLFTLSTDEDGYPMPTEQLVDFFRTRTSPDGLSQLPISYEQALVEATDWLNRTRMVIDSLQPKNPDNQ